VYTVSVVCTQNSFVYAVVSLLGSYTKEIYVYTTKTQVIIHHDTMHVSFIYISVFFVYIHKRDLYMYIYTKETYIYTKET